MNHTPSPKATFEKHFTSSILLWMREDQPRQAGMDHWKGPHSGIIAATPGLTEYRQIHLAAENPGRWPAAAGLETEIAEDRRVDGIAEVTFESALAPLMGRKQTQLAYADEVNVFRRTLLYAGPPGSSRWYDAAEGPVGVRSVLYLRRAVGTSRREFCAFVRDDLTEALAAASVLTELRTQVFLPWNEHTWDTPDVAHYNPKQHRFHGSLILGFRDQAARTEFFDHTAETFNPLLQGKVEALHAYDAATTLTFVENGTILDEPHA